MTIFKKRLFCIVAACLMFILPFISWGGGTIKEAKADEITYRFNGSNLFFNSMSFYANGFNRTGLPYLTFGYERFIGLPSKSSMYLPLEKPIYYYSGGRYNANYTYGDTNAPISFKLDLGRSVSSSYVPGITDPIYEFRFSLSDFTVFSSALDSAGYFSYIVNASFFYSDVGDYGPYNTLPLLGNPGFNISDRSDNVGGDVVVVNGLSGTFSSDTFVNGPKWLGIFPSKYADDLDVFAPYSIPIYALVRFDMSSPSFNCNVVKIELGSFYVNDSVTSGSNWFLTIIQTYQGQYCISYVTLPYNFVRYYDNNGEYFEYAIPVNLGTTFVQENPGSLLFEPRTYYLAASSSSFQEGYNEGFKEGQTALTGAVNSAIRDTNEKWEKVVDERVAEELELAKKVEYDKGFQAGANTQFGFGMFMSSILDVLNTPIFGSFGLGDMFMVVFGVGIVIIVLKIFAGG